MIPYYKEPLFHLGALTIHAFSVMMIVAILVGRWIILRRARRFGINPDWMSRLCVWMLLAGLLGADLLKTVLPNFAFFLADPWMILRTSAGIASLGGLGGGLLGGIVWCRLHRLSNFESLRMLDVIAYALPFAWLFGRFGCTLAHDHRGLPTNSWIGIRFPEGVRFDLGLIEFLFLIALAICFYILDRRPRPAGFFFGMYGFVYGLFRMWLDTLHLQPLRFLGGVWACLIGLAGWAAMTWFARQQRTIPAADSGIDLIGASSAGYSKVR